MTRESAKRPAGKYTVLVDDNYHYQDETARHRLGSFDALEEAVRACKQVVDRSLEEMSSRGGAILEKSGPTPPCRSLPGSRVAALEAVGEEERHQVELEDLVLVLIGQIDDAAAGANPHLGEIAVGMEVGGLDELACGLWRADEAYRPRAVDLIGELLHRGDDDRAAVRVDAPVLCRERCQAPDRLGARRRTVDGDAKSHRPVLEELIGAVDHPLAVGRDLKVEDVALRRLDRAVELDGAAAPRGSIGALKSSIGGALLFSTAETTRCELGAISKSWTTGGW